MCENPDILEAFLEREARLGALVVCTEGGRSVAALRFLRDLSRAGILVRVHADFDWGGVVVARTVLRDTGGEPWRFGGADYAEALALAGERTTALGAARGTTPSGFPTRAGHGLGRPGRRGGGAC